METILIEMANNRGTLHAVVEQDERTAYFYIYPGEHFSERYGMRACWLRNLQAAPVERDSAAMEDGKAPMLEARYCNHPAGLAPLETAELSIMWNEADDGATVFYQDEPLGIIPGWTLYAEQSAYYAADCSEAAEDRGLFPLTAPALYKGLEQASAFWDKWGNEDNNPWMPLQRQFLEAYEARFGSTLKYFAIDNQQWPPMALAQYEQDDIIYFLSLGVSIRPMPWVEFLYNEQAGGFRRMELGLAVNKNDYSMDEIMNMAQSLAGIADSPWRNLTWLGEGHTISSSGLPAGYDSFILSSALYKGPEIALPLMEGDRVNLYWATPVTLAERERAHSKPNGGYALLETFIEEGRTHVVKKG